MDLTAVLVTTPAPGDIVIGRVCWFVGLLGGSFATLVVISRRAAYKSDFH